MLALVLKYGTAGNSDRNFIDKCIKVEKSKSYQYMMEHSMAGKLISLEENQYI